jgi:hypothetical protein
MKALVPIGAPAMMIPWSGIKQEVADLMVIRGLTGTVDME